MKDFTKYEYQIYSYSEYGPDTNITYICCSQEHRIQISNISVLSQLAKYEYKIYS